MWVSLPTRDRPFLIFQRIGPWKAGFQGHFSSRKSKLGSYSWSEPGTWVFSVRAWVRGRG